MFLNTILKSELKKLNASKEDLQNKLPSLPSGDLRIWKNGKGYRWVKYEGGKRVVISKEHFSEAADLALKKYIEYQLEDIDRKEVALEKCLAVFDEPSKSEGLLAKKSFYELFNKVNLQHNEFAKEWERSLYNRSSYKMEFLVHDTLKGEKVRSKAEALIADALYRSSLPYRYEQELRFGSTVLYPDFTILSHDREIIWEHMGLLSKDDYARNNTAKISNYISYGYFPGDTLIITSESVERPLSAIVVERIIDCFLL